MRRKVEVVAAVIGASAVLGGAALAATSPSVVTGGTSSVGQTSAVLHGTVNPNGSSTTYFFQWGLTKGYGVNGPGRSAGSGTKAVSVQDTARDLIPGTTYHYRLVAANAGGTTVGADRTFKTAGHAPPAGAATGPATNLSTSGATLTGAVNPAGNNTTWRFDWGTTTSYGQQTKPQTLPGFAPAQNVAVSLQGLLAAGTIYHYRLVASHSGTTTFGSDQSFMTYPSPRPVPIVRATTLPHRTHRRPAVYTTSGSIFPPAWMPAQYACNGIVTIRFFRGIRQVHFNIAAVQPNCTFSARTTFKHVPGGHPPAHLRVVIRFLATHYLKSDRAGYGHVTLK
jgi:hypothetical protein